MVVSNFFYFHPYLGKWSNFTNIFQMGWNHQPDNILSFLGWLLAHEKLKSPTHKSLDLFFQNVFFFFLSERLPRPKPLVRVSLQEVWGFGCSSDLSNGGGVLELMKAVTSWPCLCWEDGSSQWMVQWLITMVIVFIPKSWGCGVPLTNGLNFMACKWGVILTTY